MSRITNFFLKTNALFHFSMNEVEVFLFRDFPCRILWARLSNGYTLWKWSDGCGGNYRKLQCFRLLNSTLAIRCLSKVFVNTQCLNAKWVLKVQNIFLFKDEHFLWVWNSNRKFDNLMMGVARLAYVAHSKLWANLHFYFGEECFLLFFRLNFCRFHFFEKTINSGKKIIFFFGTNSIDWPPNFLLPFPYYKYGPCIFLTISHLCLVPNSVTVLTSTSMYGSKIRIHTTLNALRKIFSLVKTVKCLLKRMCSKTPRSLWSKNRL